MSLLRDSAIVGAATFLIGSVFMGISVKQEGEPVGWWPYVGTFMSGALGFYLLGATNVVKVKNAEYKVTDGYEDCEVCAKTCDIKTDPLHDVQAGRICSDCHYLNEYGVEKGAESYSAEDVICAYCEEVIEENPTVTHGETVYHDYCAEKLIALSDGHGLHERDIAYWGAESFSAEGLRLRNLEHHKNNHERTPIENLMIQQGMISGDSWDMPKGMFPKYFARNEGKRGSIKIDSAKVVRDGDSYSIVVKATQQMGIKNVYHRDSSFSVGPYPYTADGWFNGYMRWAETPMKGRDWATEVQANLGDFTDGYQPTAWSGAVKNAESFDRYGRKIRKLVGNCPVCHGFFDVKPPNPEACNCDEDFSAESPTDDELEMWSYREEDGSMLVSIDEDGDLHTELTYKDGDLINLKRFMAEVFEADRKARRRTTLTWARGIEPSFSDRDNTPNDSDESVSQSMFKQHRPYENDQYDYGYQYSNDNAYHIKGLPPGFHIHLWKPPKRGDWWQAYLKSPNTDEWQEEYSQSKRDLMDEVLGWYNDAIAVPEETELSPIQQLMIGQGMISGDIQIHRIVPTPGKIQYYFSGGSEAFAPTLFATYGGDLEFNTDDIPSTILHFCRGLIYIGVETAGNVRSVNRYNKDRKQWVSSHPAWFQNMCKQGIKDLHFGRNSDGLYTINDFPFLQFYGSRSLPEKKYLTITKEEVPMFQVRVEGKYPNLEDGWITPRPSTQRKMYGTKLKWPLRLREISIFNKCVAKYQPQEWKEIHDDMLEGTVTQNTDGWGLDGQGEADDGASAPAGHIMCRRFKKK
jgi:hypothetical protein